MQPPREPFSYWPGVLFLHRDRPRTWQRPRTKIVACSLALEGLSFSWCEGCQQSRSCLRRLHLDQWPGYWKQLIAQGKLPDPASPSKEIQLKLLEHVLPLLEVYRRRRLAEEHQLRKVATLWKASQAFWTAWVDKVLRPDPALRLQITGGQRLVGGQRLAEDECLNDGQSITGLTCLAGDQPIAGGQRSTKDPHLAPLAADKRLTGDKRLAEDPHLTAGERLAGEQRLSMELCLTGDIRLAGDKRLAGEQRLPGEQPLAANKRFLDLAQETRASCRMSPVEEQRYVGDQPPIGEQRHVGEQPLMRATSPIGDQRHGEEQPLLRATSPVGDKLFAQEASSSVGTSPVGDQRHIEEQQHVEEQPLTRGRSDSEGHSLAGSTEDSMPTGVSRLFITWLGKVHPDLAVAELRRELVAVVTTWHQQLLQEPPAVELPKCRDCLSGLLSGVMRKVSSLLLDRRYDSSLETLWDLVERHLRISIGNQFFREQRSLTFSGNMESEGVEAEEAEGPVRLGGRTAKSEALYRLSPPKKASGFNYARLKKYSPKLDRLRRKKSLTGKEVRELNLELLRIMEEADKAEAIVVGAGRLLSYAGGGSGGGGDEEKEDSKAKRFKSLQRDSEPWLHLRDDLRRHLDEVLDPGQVSPEVLKALRS